MSDIKTFGVSKLDVITKMLKTVLQKQDEQAQLLKGTTSRVAIEGATATVESK